MILFKMISVYDDDYFNKTTICNVNTVDKDGKRVKEKENKHDLNLSSLKLEVVFHFNFMIFLLYTIIMVKTIVK